MGVAWKHDANAAFKQFKSVHTKKSLFFNHVNKMLTSNLLTRCKTKQLRTILLTTWELSSRRKKKWQMRVWQWVNFRTFWGSSNSSSSSNTLINQSHRYGRHQAACGEPAGSYDKTTRTAICFEHKTQYLLIRAPYTRIVVFWHISNIPPMISQSQMSCNTPCFI